MESTKSKEPLWTTQVKLLEMHAKAERKNGNIEKAITILTSASTIAKAYHGYGHSRNLVFRCAKYCNIFANQLFDLGKIRESAAVYKMEIGMLIEAQKDESAKRTILRVITKFINEASQSCSKNDPLNKVFSLYMEALSMAVEYRMLGYAQGISSAICSLPKSYDDQASYIKAWGAIGANANKAAHDLGKKSDYKNAAQWCKFAEFAYGMAENPNAAESMKMMSEIFASQRRN